MFPEFHRDLLYMTLMVRHHVFPDRPLISVYGHILSDAVQYTLYKCCIWCNDVVRNQTLLYCITEMVFFPHCGYHHHHRHHHVVCLTTGPQPLPNELLRQCDLMLPVSISSTLLFP